MPYTRPAVIGPWTAGRYTCEPNAEKAIKASEKSKCFVAVYIRIRDPLNWRKE